MALPFNSIYFDTQPLREANWPFISTKLRVVLLLAGQFDVPVYIPAPTRDEIRAQWVRDLEEKQRGLQSATRLFNDHLSSLTSDASISGPQLSEVLANFDRRVESIVNQFAIRTTDFPEMPVKHFFQMALEEKAPFKPKGTGFKDAVILISVIEHLARQSNGRGAFISRDKDFEPTAATLLSARSNCLLSFIPSLDALESILEQELAALDRELWDRDKQRATDAFNAQMDRLRDFVLAKLELPERELSIVSKVLKIDKLVSVKIRDVQTPSPLERPNGPPFTVSADLEVELEVTVERLPGGQPQVLKVGETPQRKLSHVDMLAAAMGMYTSTVTRKTVVTVEATAKANDKSFEILNFIGLQNKGVTGLGLGDAVQAYL